MKKIKATFVFGTRPEAIKLAPLIKELENNKYFITKVIVTAQHRSMLDRILILFNITPDYDLSIMQPNQSLTQITTKVLKKLEKIFVVERPDLVLVQGDTTTTLAAALAAYYQKIKVAHIEAGLRTYDKYKPYPEEMNRYLVDCIADLHFAPTLLAKNNLLNMGINKDSIFVTGNTVIDALLTIAGIKYEFPKSKRWQQVLHSCLILVTAHRRESFGKPLRNICAAINKLSTINNLLIVFSVHKNPNVRKEVKRMLKNKKNIILTEPLDYQLFVNLMKEAYIILTDSGGIQEEAPIFGKPILIMREVTEREEIIRAGCAKLVGTDTEKIVTEVCELLDNKKIYTRMAKKLYLYGDGEAKERIAKFILYYYNIIKTKPKEFIRNM